MGDFKILVEGVADIQFIKQYVKHILDIDLIQKNHIDKTGGWTNISSLSQEGEAIRIEMQRNKDNGKKNIIIFDADTNYVQRRDEINSWKSKFNLEFELFLFPNNLNSGTLEDLLENIINPVNNPIFDCWDSYEKCLRTKSISGRSYPLTTPAKKTKIYGYLEALLGPSHSEKQKIKEIYRDYLNTDYWNLDTNYLTPLKDFLTTYTK